MWTDRGLNHQPPIEDDVLTSDSDDDTPVVLGLAGRISTADGRILSDPTIILELQRMEHERSQEQLRRAERAAQREIDDADELPIRLLLRKLSILEGTDRPTKAHMLRLYTQYLSSCGGSWTIAFDKNGVRNRMVESLRSFIPYSVHMY